MTVEPPPDFREELDIVRIDPLFLERQRNRYASRGVAFLVILNGIAALVLLANFARLSPQIENAPTLAAAMVVFGAGVAAALASMFFAYLRRTLRIEAPERAPLRPLGWWLAVLAAVASTACFFTRLRAFSDSVCASKCASKTA
jgi:amino acid transporter